MIQYPATPHVVVCDLPHSPQMGLRVGCCQPRRGARGPVAVFIQREPGALWEHAATATWQAAIGELLAFDECSEPDEADEWEDHESSLRVRMYGRDLYSVDPVDVRQGYSVLMVGGELLAYSVADQVGPSEYLLRGLWRGVRDTGPAVGSHRPGEPVMLMDAGLSLIPYDPGDVGETWSIKVASGEQNLSQLPVAWTGELTGAAGVPFRPMVWRDDGGRIQYESRSRWRGTIGCDRASLAPSEMVEAWQVSDDGVRQVGQYGPGRWASFPAVAP